LLLAVLGSVAGTLVTNAFATSQNLSFTTSQNLTLFGAVLGAAIPPLIAVAGPYTNLRLGLGLLIAVGALVLTYGGFIAKDKLSNTPASETIFPVPGPFPTPIPHPTTGPTPSTSTTDPSPDQPDLRLQLKPTLTCSVTPGGGFIGNDTLTISVKVLNSGPGQLSGKVPYTIKIDTRSAVTGNAGLGTFTAMTVGVRPTDYQHTLRVVVSVDPADKIAELNEANNTLAVTVALPAQKNQQQPVPCKAA
jgi:hypothetical protein